MSGARRSMVIVVACGVLAGCRKSADEPDRSLDFPTTANSSPVRHTVDRDRADAVDGVTSRNVDEVLARTDLSDDQASGALLRIVTNSNAEPEMRREALRHASMLATDRLLVDRLVIWLREGLCSDPLMARAVLDAARDRDADVRIRLAAAVRDSTTGPVAEEALELLAVDLDSEPSSPEWEKELAQKLKDAEQAVR